MTRLEWQTGSSYPGGAALGVVDEPATTEAVAASIAAELAAAGVNWNLAPVADVNVPANPVIGARAFGSDPRARRAARRRVRSRARSRATSPRARSTSPATARPTQDSHLELPALIGDLEARARAVPRRDRRRRAVDHDRARPRARTRRRAGDARAARIVQGLLRGELGFDGRRDRRRARDEGASARPSASRSSAVRALAGGRRRALRRPRPRRGRLSTAIRRRARRRGRRGAASRGGGAGRGASRTGRSRCAGAADRAVGADAARRALLVDGDVALRRGAARSSSCARARTSPPARPSTRSARAVVREGEPVPAADVYVVRDAHRHPWMQAAADVDGAVVVETGLPVWRPERGARLRRDVRRRPRLARARPSCCARGACVTTHLERELRRAARGARAADRAPAGVRRGDRGALPPRATSSTS